MIAHLEPDILEFEVKWALGSITTNNASGDDGIPAELFQILKVLWKCCTQYASKFGKLSSGHRTEKGQFSSQSQRKAMPKNVQTAAQSHSSWFAGGLVAKSCLDWSPPGSSAHGILQARIVEWVAILFRGSSWPRKQTRVSWIAGRFFTNWAIGKPMLAK